MLVSGAQQSDSVIYMCVCVYILFHYRLLKGIEYSSLCYTVGPCCLSVFYTVICIGPASVLLLTARLVFPLSLHGFTSPGGFPTYTLPTACLHSTHQRPDPPHIFLPLGFPLQGASTNHAPGSQLLPLLASRWSCCSFLRNVPRTLFLITTSLAEACPGAWDL